MLVSDHLFSNEVLLDTHILVWLLNNEKKLSQRLKLSILQARSEKRLFISPMTSWEIGMLESKGRMSFEIPCLDWIEQTLKLADIQLASITPSILVKSSNLEGSLSKDPVDRILVATAMESHHVLVTCDEKIISFARSNSVLVHDARKHPNPLEEFTCREGNEDLIDWSTTIFGQLQHTIQVHDEILN